MADCPSCHSTVETDEGASVYCPHCHTIFREGRSIAEDDAGVYRFCDTGYYGYVARRPPTEDPVVPDGLPSVHEQARGVIFRMVGLIGWIGLIFLLPLEEWFWLKALGISVLVLLLGCHWSNLMMYGIWKPCLFPRSLHRVCRLASYGKITEATRLAEQERLMGHPGVMVSMAQGLISQGEKARGRQLVLDAAKECPNHPYVQHLVKALASESCN